MNIMYQCCCGMDIYKNVIVACVFNGKEKDVRSFSTMTESLLGLVDWLKSVECQCVAMESTDSYWKPIYNLRKMEEIALTLHREQVDIPSVYAMKKRFGLPKQPLRETALSVVTYHD